MKIGIIGQGYVGKAVKTVFAEKFPNILAYDKYVSDLSDVKNERELSLSSEIIFLCLPTPMKENGECDTSIIEDELVKINDISSTENKKIVVIKSTVTPGSSEKFSKHNKNIKIVFNPEFLTELNFIEDFRKQNRIIIGGESEDACAKVSNLYKDIFPKVPIILTSSKTAEMVKYLTNTFLASKVAYANQLKAICDATEINFDEVVELSTLDERLGKSHWSVPGPDGEPGFGGSCFPKDLNALIYFAKVNGVNYSLLNEIWQYNLKIRSDRNWKNKREWQDTED